MYCINCGAEIGPNANFCPVCGGPQQMQLQYQQPPYQQPVQMPSQYQQPMQMQQPQYQSMDMAPVEQPQIQQKQKKNKTGNKKGKKIAIAVGAVVALAALVVLGIFVIAPRVKRATMSPQERAVDVYFEALDNKDFYALDEVAFPAEAIKNGAGIINAGGVYGNKLTQQFGFTRGALELDIYRMNQDAMKVIYRDYPQFNPETYGSMERYQEIVQSQTRSLELFEDLSVGYKLYNMKNYKDVNIYYRDGLKQIPIPDIDKLIKSGDNYLDLDDLYIAEVHVDWSYGDLKYGWNPDWWVIKETKPLMENWGRSYEDIMYEYDNRRVCLLVYQYKGDWYVYPESLVMNMYGYEKK